MSAFAADITDFDVFRRHWDARVGTSLPLSRLDVAEGSGFHIRVRACTADDVVIADVHSRSLVGRIGGDGDPRAIVHLVSTGAWRFTGPDSTVTVPSGHFSIRHDIERLALDVEPGTTARMLVLPAAVLGPPVNGRVIVASATSPEIRVLAAHTEIVARTVADLSAAGARAARDALLELVRGVVRSEFDDVEPRHAAALARAAKTVIEEHLADDELSPATVARELAVSVRTLHRAFAGTGESVAGHIRGRRLERARFDLAAPAGPPTISEVAARWHFSHGSHFTREFKKRYGLTPIQFTRSLGATPTGSTSPR